MCLSFRSVVVSNDQLLKILLDRKVSKGDLQKLTQLSSVAIANILKNESATMDVVGRICEALKCSIVDVLKVPILPPSTVKYCSQL